MKNIFFQTSIIYLAINTGIFATDRALCSQFADLFLEYKNGESVFSIDVSIYFKEVVAQTIGINGLIEKSIRDGESEYRDFKFNFNTITFPKLSDSKIIRVILNKKISTPLMITNSKEIVLIVNPNTSIKKNKSFLVKALKKTSFFKSQN